MSNREAMQQALEALEELDGLDTETECVTIDVGEVITALRTALEQPEQEPVAWMVTYGGLTHVEYTLPSKVVDTHYQPLYTTTPAAQWDKPSASFNEWWDSYHIDPANPFAEGSAAFWAWAGWKAAQRPWQGLTDDDWAAIEDMPDTFDQGVAWAAARLKERNK